MLFFSQVPSSQECTQSSGIESEEITAMVGTWMFSPEEVQAACELEVLHHISSTVRLAPCTSYYHHLVKAAVLFS